jgi:hypothetical protein
VQRSRRPEHEDGEGKSPVKKDDDTTHQGGRAPTRWRMGLCDDVSSRATSLRQASVTVAESCSTGVLREVREAD